MLAKFRIIKIMVTLWAIVLLNQCTRAIEPPTSDKPIKAKSVASPIPFNLPATAYFEKSKDQPEKKRQTLLIMAAGRFIHDGQWRDGLQILTKLTALSAAEANAKKILLAKTDLIREQPRAAIARLATVQDRDGLSLYYQIQYHELLASAYELVGTWSESLSERIKLGKLLPDEASQINNSRTLWLSLVKLPLAELHTLAVEQPEDSILEGWIKLALIARKKSEKGYEVFAQMELWQSQYPSHPANRFLPSLNSIKPLLHHSSHQMALLLPLTGPLAGPGGAIRDGFLAAAKNSSTKVVLYDTALGKAADLYQQAIQEGADYVVGPLTKKEVASVAEMQHPVPTVLLNEVETSSNPNAYHFGLSPSQEARQVAIQASKRGYRQALVIAPEGPWGNEIVSAFQSQWESNGGKIVDRLAFGNHENLNLAVRDLLRVSESQAREKKLKELLGRKLQTIPSRREDFDMIFLLAYPSKARQIMPLLRYYFAGSVPVYATSSVYSGSPNIMKDKDLEGILFSDLPWVFSNQVGNRNWPEQFNSYNRLYALGMESFALSRKLNQLLIFPNLGIKTRAGIFFLNTDHQITRIPAWGRFKDGVAILTG